MGRGYPGEGKAPSSRLCHKAALGTKKEQWRSDWRNDSTDKSIGLACLRLLVRFSAQHEAEYALASSSIFLSLVKLSLICKQPNKSLKKEQKRKMGWWWEEEVWERRRERTEERSWEMTTQSESKEKPKENGPFTFHRGQGDMKC